MCRYADVNVGVSVNTTVDVDDQFLSVLVPAKNNDAETLQEIVIAKEQLFNCIARP